MLQSSFSWESFSSIQHDDVNGAWITSPLCISSLQSSLALSIFCQCSGASAVHLGLVAIASCQFKLVCLYCKPPQQVWAFPPILFLFPEGGHAHTPSSLAQRTCVSAVSAVISEHSAISQLRSAEALNLLPSLIGSSLVLMRFQTTLQSSAFPPLPAFPDVSV